MSKTKNDERSKEGMLRDRMLHSLEAEGIVEKVDAWKMNEASILQDPEKALPRPRSDLPKNKHHQSIHEL